MKEVVMTMLKQLRKEWHSVSHIVHYQIGFVVLMMSFGLFIDHNGTMTVIALLLYPMIFPTLIVVMDHSYQGTIIALPVSRTSYILSKYIFGYLVSTCTILIGFLYGYVVTEYIVPNGVVIEPFISFKGFLLCITPMIFLSGITLPVFFKFSKRKGSIVLMVVYVILVIALFITIIYFEKTIKTGLNYSDKDVFPVIIEYIGNKIQLIGIAKIKLYFAVSVIAYTASSICLSVFFFIRKDIGE